MSASLPSSNDLTNFRSVVAETIERHPIVRDNAYLNWFEAGNITRHELRDFTVQFSVFSHLFIEAQLRKCINAPDRQSYRAGKEILLNELGVAFTPKGTVDGGTFRFTAGHFEWLAQFAQTLGLQWSDIGKRRHGRATTLAFCDALLRWYGAEDESTAAGASHAIEHWAAGGFWKQLIAGLRIVKETSIAELPLGFWTWHDALEAKHAAHTDDELRDAFAKPDFSCERFVWAGEAMLQAVAEFWSGLDDSRLGTRAPDRREA
ncbi:MAG: hypothetical protein JO092_10295 [Candidatus Eremiobacteraeota bacterium]|nr:hypothetical protein [Candidatus Eremiobacteraeota bacterium]